MMQLDQAAIRRQNTLKILELLSAGSAMTRRELARNSALSLMSVTNLVDLLKEQNVLSFDAVEHTGPKRRCTGRRADSIFLRSEGHAWLIVDISGRGFRFSLRAFDMSPLWEGTGEDGDGDYSGRLERFLRGLNDGLTDALAGRELLGVAIVTPGPYDVDSDSVLNLRLPQLDGIRIKALFRQCLGEYDYYVDEDVKFAVRACVPGGDPGQYELLYYLYIGEGVGGAAIHQGNMLRGLNAVAGDAGQLTSGGGATYENRISLAAFADALGIDAARGATELEQALAVSSASRPDEYAAALRRIALTTADMLHSVLWLLDPSHIVIECGYAEPCREQYVEWITAALRAMPGATGRRMPVIRLAPGDSRNVLRGAAQALRRLWVERIVP